MAIELWSSWCYSRDHWLASIQDYKTNIMVVLQRYLQAMHPTLTADVIIKTSELLLPLVKQDAALKKYLKVSWGTMLEIIICRLCGWIICNILAVVVNINIDTTPGWWWCWRWDEMANNNVKSWVSQIGNNLRHQPQHTHTHTSCWTTQRCLNNYSVWWEGREGNKVLWLLTQQFRPRSSV